MCARGGRDSHPSLFSLFIVKAHDPIDALRTISLRPLFDRICGSLVFPNFDRIALVEMA